MRLGRTLFEHEGWQVSIQQSDRIGRYEHIYIFRDHPDRRIELYRSPRGDELSPVIEVIDDTVYEPPQEFAIVVPAGFGEAVAKLAAPGPSQATMDELRDRLKVADARVDKLIDHALEGLT